ncbi:MAG: T9SS type A sorting domain-containing protein [Candidatus Zixiibacteriota bacterium]
MRRLLMCIALLMGIMLVTAGIAEANPMATESPYVFFRIDSASAFISGTRMDTNETVATVHFSFKDTDPAHNGVTLTNAIARIKFDHTKLQLLDADTVTGSGFPNDVIRTDSVGDTLTWVRLELYGGTATVPSSYRDVVALKFRPLCQAEGSIDSVLFFKSNMENVLTITGFPTVAPVAGNYVDGRVSVNDYVAHYAIGTDTLVGGVGQKVMIPVTATTDFKTYWFEHFLVWDQTKLRLDSIPHGPEIGFVFAQYYAADTLDFLAINSAKMPQFDGDTLYRLWFTVMCDSPQVNGTVPITFWTDSCAVQPSPCSMNPGPTYGNGGVVLDDHASFAATLNSGGTVSMYASSTVQWHVNMINTFTAGLRSGQTYGITFNVNTNTQALRFSAVPATETHGLKYGYTTSSNQYNSLYQQDTIVDTVPYSDAPSHLLTLSMDWTPALFGTPTWANRFITPAFIATFAGAPAATAVPDVHCFRSNDTSLLTYGSFDDAIEVLMADFKAFGFNSTNACTYFDMKVRNNFLLDSFILDVAITAGWCINSVTGTPTGVVVTYPGSNVVRFTTNSSFAGMNPSTDYVAFGRINVGKNLTCSFKPMNYSVGATLSNEHAYAVGGQPQYALKVNGGATARCIPPGNNCCGVVQPEGDPEGRISKLEGGLPTDFALNQNYPNPFNPVTTISLDLPRATSWRITVFNISGQVVKEYSGTSGPGTVEVEFDGSHIASGVYIYRVEASEFVATKKMILMK